MNPQLPVLQDRKFECQPNCGACCEFDGMLVLDMGRDIRRLESRFKRERGWLTHKFGLKPITFEGDFWFGIPSRDGACVFLDRETKRCNIWDHRPQRCKSYPFWPKLVEDDDAWGNVKEICPGMGKGTQYRATEMLDILRGRCGTFRGSPAYVSESRQRRSTAKKDSQG